MSLDYRRKRRTASATLSVTFLLGVAIGFTLCYAILQLGRTEDREAELPAASGEPPMPTIVHLVSDQERPRPAPESEQVTPEPVQVTPEPPPASRPSPPPVWPARHLLIGISGTALDPATTELLRTFRPGGIVLRAENVVDADQTRALVEAVIEAIPWSEEELTPPLIAAAQRGGDENPLRLDEAPAPRDVARLADTQAIRDLARRTARSCRERGVGLLFAPSLDVYAPGIAPEGFDPRTFAADAAVVAAVGLEYLAGLEAGGMAACVVHYPGAGGAVLDDAGLLVVRETDIEKLEAMIRPFDEAVQRDVPAVLVGHVAVPAIEKAEAPIPASCSPKLVRMLLREKRRFAGTIIADDVSRGESVGGRSPEDTVVQALAAGCDAVIVMDASQERLNAICAVVAEATAAGVLQEQELQSSRDRLDALRARIEAYPAPRPGEVVPPPGAEPVKHRVKEGETLSSIATQYGVAVNDLQRWNRLDDPSLIKFGQELTVYVAPKPTEPAPEPAPLPLPEPMETPTEPAPEPPSPETPPETAAPEPPPAPETPPQQASEKAGQAEATIPPPHTQHRVYRVVPGDTLAKIAEQYGVSPEDISRWNKLEGKEPLPGNLLDVYLPLAEGADDTTFEEYRVGPGDTLHGIALRYGVTVPELLKHNKISNPNVLIEGQRIKIPKSP